MMPPWDFAFWCLHFSSFVLKSGDLHMESFLWKTKQCHFTVAKVAWIPHYEPIH